MFKKQKKEQLAQYKKQIRTLQIKKQFLLEECQKNKDKLDQLRNQLL